MVAPGYAPGDLNDSSNKPVIMTLIHKRWDGENQWYFVTIATKKRDPFFSEPSLCKDLKQAFNEIRKFHVFRLAGLAILADHWHGLIRPSSPAVIENIVSAIKKNIMQTIWKQQKRTSIWQQRFLDRRIRNEEDFWFHMEYIRTNAVKHGYVKKPEEYDWIFIHEDPFGKR